MKNIEKMPENDLNKVKIEKKIFAFEPLGE